MRKRTGAVVAAMTIAAIAALPVVAATKLTGHGRAWLHDQDAHEADEGGQVHARRERQVEQSQLPPQGPGRNVKTSVARTGTKSFAITLVKGKYTFVCDAHPTR